MSVTTVFDPVVFLKPEKIEFGEGCRIDSFVKIEGGNGVHVGKYVHIASFAHVNIGGGTVFIGDYAMIASGARILGGTNCPDGWSCSSVAPKDKQVVMRTITEIESRAFICAGATVLAGVRIGEAAILGAGSVATKRIPPYEIWAGVPARFIKRRSF